MNPSETMGLSIRAFSPLWVLGASKQKAELTGRVQSYSHEKLARGGDWTAQIQLTVSLAELEAWVEDGIGRHVTVHDAGGDYVFEGFVDRITAAIAGVTVEVGPLMSIANRVSVSYTPIDYTIYPPATGTETTTTIEEDTTSQARYGIIEKMQAAGQCTTAQAEQIRSIYLAENAYPRKSTPSTTIAEGGSGGGVTMTLDVLGYINCLQWYIYNRIGTGITDLANKIERVLVAEPNGILNYNDVYIQANALLVPASQTGNMYAWDVLQELFTLGNDTTDELRNFGLRPGRIPYYSARVHDIEYWYYTADPAQRITKRTGQALKPWLVNPGVYMAIPDFLPGYPIPDVANFANDPRVRFIDSVRYSAPYSLDLSSDPTSRLPQYLAKLSMGGF